MKTPTLIFFTGLFGFFASMLLGEQYKVFAQDEMTKQCYYSYPWWWEVLYFGSFALMLPVYFYCLINQPAK